jgi:DNA-binding NarL/FixJ family response regulator
MLAMKKTSRRGMLAPRSNDTPPLQNRLTVGELELRVVSLPSEPRKLPEALTPSERDVVRLLVRGMSYRQIAKARGVTEDTVSAQVSATMAKLAVESAHGIVAKLASYGARE